MQHRGITAEREERVAKSSEDFERSGLVGTVCQQHGNSLYSCIDILTFIGPFFHSASLDPFVRRSLIITVPVPAPRQILSVTVPFPVEPFQL